jgi:hypothetical protein
MCGIIDSVASATAESLATISHSADDLTGMNNSTTCPPPSASTTHHFFNGYLLSTIAGIPAFNYHVARETFQASAPEAFL